MLIIFLSKCAECLEILPTVIFVTPFRYHFRKGKAINDTLKEVADRQVPDSLLEGFEFLYHWVVFIEPEVRGYLAFFILFTILFCQIV